MSESNSKATIPQPREGALGEWDKCLGPGASGSPSGYAWLPALPGFRILLGHGTPRGPLSGLRHRRRLRRG